MGAPWLDAVSDNPLDMNLVPSMKRKKGKKKEAAGVCTVQRGPDAGQAGLLIHGYQQGPKHCLATQVATVKQPLWPRPCK